MIRCAAVVVLLVGCAKADGDDRRPLASDTAGAVAGAVPAAAAKPPPPSPAAVPPPDAATLDANPAGMDAMSEVTTASMTALDRVKAHVGPGHSVSPVYWHGTPVVELYTAHRDDGPRDNRVALAATARDIATGRAGMKLVVLANSEPLALAEAAALLLVDGGPPMVDAANLENHPAAAAFAPPSLDGTTLTYWGHAGRGRSPLMRIQVDLRTFKVDARAPDELARAGKDPVDLALAGLASASRFDQKAAVEDLARLARKEARARAGLERAALEVKDVDARSLAVTSLGSQKPKGAHTVETLIQVLQHDADESVRVLAAQNLGRLRDAAARPALDAALQHDPSATVRTAARGALTQLDAK